MAAFPSTGMHYAPKDSSDTTDAAYPQEGESFSASSLPFAYKAIQAPSNDSRVHRWHGYLSSIIRLFKPEQLPSTGRDLCYLGLKSNGCLLKSVGRKLRCGCDILLALFVVISAIGIPIGSFSMYLLFACSEMPMFPREVKRGDLLKRCLPLRAICYMRGLCSCLIDEQILIIRAVLYHRQQTWPKCPFALL